MQFLRSLPISNLCVCFSGFIVFRKDFEPPAKENILRFRSLNYQGEAHPATRKSVVTVQVKDLFESGKLDSSPYARRKLLLLAGVRWDPMGEEVKYEDLRLLEKEAIKNGLGMIKISSERFPEERMNLKWCSDTIDKLIEEANVSKKIKIGGNERVAISSCLDTFKSEPEKMKDVPLDFRHITVREAKRNGFARRKAPSIQDFPETWLPSSVLRSNEGS